MTADLSFQYLTGGPLAAANVVILPVAYDATVCGRKGTANGPAAILEASADHEYFEFETGWSPFLHSELHIAELLHRKPGEAEAAFHGRLSEIAKRLKAGAADRNLLVALGGEHAITPSIVSGAMPQPGTILIFDAHADLRQTYQGTPFSHACASHRLRELGHRLIQVGLRSMTAAEAQRLETDSHITWVPAREAHDPAIRARLMALLRDLQGPVWVSIDMDAFDPSLVPSVGTPQPGGLDWRLVVDALAAVSSAKRAELKGVDVVEVIPEDSRVSQTVAAALVQKAIAFWGKAMGLDKQPETGAQSRIAYE